MNMNIYNSKESQAICDALDLYYSLLDDGQKEEAFKLLSSIKEAKRSGFK